MKTVLFFDFVDPTANIDLFYAHAIFRNAESKFLLGILMTRA